MLRIFLSDLLFIFSIDTIAQGVGIPSKTSGIGFGNLPRFSGIRFNFADKRVKKISGINFTVWQAKQDSLQTGQLFFYLPI